MGGVKSHFKKTGDGGANLPAAATTPQKSSESNSRKKADGGGLALPKRQHREMIDPQIVAKYDIKALIGKGSFSRVVRVEHKVTRMCYALKIIDLRKESRFCETELAVLTRLRHPNVIQLVDMLKTPQRCYMVIELATGGDLFERIVNKGFLPEIESVKILQMLLSGLDYLHHQGVVHRDMKPENVLFEHPGFDSKVLISDFGLAHQQSDEKELMTTTCGTPEYIAPEVLLRQPYNSKVDIWAMGVVTYILLSGTMPFDDDNRNKIYRAILKAKYDFPDEYWADVSDSAVAFVKYLLDPDPNRRPTARLCLQHYWIVQSAPSLQPRSRSLHKSYSQQPPHRTRSQKSNRSIPRSDAGRRIKPEELERLMKDSEFQKLANRYAKYSRTLLPAPVGPNARVIAVV